MGPVLCLDGERRQSVWCKSLRSMLGHLFQGFSRSGPGVAITPAWSAPLAELRALLDIPSRASSTHLYLVIWALSITFTPSRMKQPGAHQTAG